MNIRRAQVLGLLGILGSLMWLSLNTVFSPEWGPPGTSRYLGYETINRLWAPAFGLVLCGYVGLYGRYRLGQTRLGRVGFGLIVLGLVVMMGGNVAEFWFLTKQPYGALNARSVAWISVLLGWLVLLIGQVLLALAGPFGRQEHRGSGRLGPLPGWATGLFLLALPASVVLIFTLVEWMGVPFVAAGVTAGALAAWPGIGLAPAKETV
jgi:hypothetical protein